MYRLTPQQQNLLSQVEDGVENRPDALLAIEGVSGVGKSTLVQLAAAGSDADLVELEYAYGRHEPLNISDKIVVVDGFDPAKIDQILAQNRGTAAKVVALMHPGLKTEKGVELIDRADLFHAAGRDFDHLRLQPMSDKQAIDYALGLNPDVDTDLVNEFGLGIAGHIRSLLDIPRDLLRAEILTLSKLRQVLVNAERYHSFDLEDMQALLGRSIGDRLSRVVQRNPHVEDKLAGKLIRARQLGVDHILPVADKTIRIYEDMLEYRDCELIVVAVPDISDQEIQELGMQRYGFDYNKRISAFGSTSRVGAATKDQLLGENQIDKHAKLFFNRFCSEDESEFSPGDNPMVFLCRNHAPVRLVQSPMAAYAIETLLQAKGRPYRVRYNTTDQGNLFYEFDGMELRKVGKLF